MHENIKNNKKIYIMDSHATCGCISDYMNPCYTSHVIYTCTCPQMLSGQL